jgi:hypothetical protein
MRSNKLKGIFHELKEHAPFTALATGSAILVVVFIFYFLKRTVSEEAFHIFHFSHITVSAMVTAGIFYKYKPKFIPALLVGVLGAIIIGSISDIIFPYLGWVSLNLDIHFHLPLLEETGFVLFSAFIGSLLGIIIGITKLPHFFHVFLSVFASLLYLLAFALIFSLSHFVFAFLIVFIAVIVPCCLSDIVFPFFFLSNVKNKEN